MSRLREFRAKAGLSQKDVSKIVKVSSQHVSRWETGIQQLPIKHAKKIAKILNCNWKDLYED